VATVDFDETVDTAGVSKTLRHHGVVDIDPYRSLGRNQLRIGTFPNVDFEDVEALLACLDWIIDSKR
ncbi:MAG: phosphoserine transaminase, partial [Ancrocorticia populi]